VRDAIALFCAALLELLSWLTQLALLPAAVKASRCEPFSEVLIHHCSCGAGRHCKKAKLELFERPNP
jgi:hypothetical protein